MTNHTMLKTTSIVCFLRSIFFSRPDLCPPLSTGMVSSRGAPTGLMGLLLSLSAQSLVETRFCTTSESPVRPVGHFFAVCLIPLMLKICLGTFWYHSHVSTQYCDGLRGPLVVYDPFDPLGWLYDVDDGKILLLLPVRCMFIVSL